MAEQQPLKHFGWGRVGEGLTAAEEDFTVGRYRALFGVADFAEREPPALAEIALRPPRLAPPAALAALCSDAPADRAAHAHGKSFPDYVHGLDGDYGNAPDLVAFPRDAGDIASVLDWAGGAGAAIIPFGGGSSVVGGVEPRFTGSHGAAITIDLRHLDRIIEIDRGSRAAHIEGGIFGPALEAGLKPHALTLRHFP
jgi:alkyldihydroxyacetonephosphate synthase